MSTTQDALTLGVEEEFQIIEAASAELAHGFEALMRGATAEIKQHMKPEFLQCVVECVTGICSDVEAVRRETMALRATAAALGRPHGLALASAGTNPTGRWYDQVRSPGERYETLEEMLQDVARSILIYGLHVHVGVDDEARRVEIVNQARTYLPHILALS
ncbi:MAG TPA: glutamate-cysteine ligase family protein, partial [Ktedonobacterales bacterium]|nr:glutamate-cysteine ligase family protein [Ktedonobacterales bacterium]